MSDSELKRVLLKSGRYSRSAAFFYHELWREHFRQIGFVVIKVEKLEQHDLWVIRLRITSPAQLQLLLSSPPARSLNAGTDPIEHRLRIIVRAFASRLGTAIRNDYLSVSRTGHYCTIAFLWPHGKAGCLLRKEKRPSAFSFLIRPWLKRNRN
jgi:hypothetical protein